MMMLRLARGGTKKKPVYQLVAADRRARRDGRFVENLGYYEPGRDILVFKNERIDYWLSTGAQPTPTVLSLIKKAKIHGNVEPVSKPKYVPPPPKPVEAKTEAAAEAGTADAPAADAPAADAAPAVEATPAAAAPEAETKTASADGAAS